MLVSITLSSILQANAVCIAWLSLAEGLCKSTSENQVSNALACICLFLYSLGLGFFFEFFVCLGFESDDVPA